MSEPFKVGDRVIIRAVRFHHDKRLVGVQGKVEHCFEDGRRFAVRTDGSDLTIATAVERVGEFSVGDRVRIVQTRDNPARNRAAVGKVGVITHVVRTGSWTTYLVDVDGDVYPAATVEAAPERDQRELHPSERALYASENHSWRDEASELDRRRLQAAEFAHRTLGTDALLEDVIGLADWILAETEEKVTGAEQTADRYIFTRGGYIPGPNVGPLVDEHAETPRPPADLGISDKDGDVLKLHYNSTLLNTVALVEAHSRGDVCSAYITTEDADRIIAFLQAAKAAKA